jgi:hypothetical protein
MSIGKPSPLRASLAASLTHSASTVPYSGPMEMAARIVLPAASVYSPTAWT